MMKRFIGRKMLVGKCLRIRNGTPFFFLGNMNLTEIYELPKGESIEKYFSQNLPKNAFCFYKNKQTQVSIAIITIGKKLYIMPAFFLDSLEKELNQLGLREAQLSTPFSNGAIPYDLDWIQQYKEEYWKAKKQYDTYFEMLGLID